MNDIMKITTRNVAGPDFQNSQCCKLLARTAELEKQLDEIQRRERAAVEGISRVAYRQRVMPCAACAFERGANHWDPCSGCTEGHSHFVLRHPPEGSENDG